MTETEFALSRDQRDDIMKAVTAIRRQLKNIGAEPHWQALYVISTNLTIIQTNVTDLPPANSN